MPMAETDATETFVKYEWKHGLSMENCNHPPQISFRIAKYRSIYADLLQVHLLPAQYLQTNELTWI